MMLLNSPEKKTKPTSDLS